MLKRPSPTVHRIHFIGIGGIGMSALARWFLNHGYAVGGSDSEISSTTQELKKDGIKVLIGHKASNLTAMTKLVIHTSAIKPDNPELKKAKSLKIKIRLYAEALGDISKKYKTIAVAGAHGKSTSASILSLVLTKAGLDPTVIVGTKLKEFGNSNFRDGKSRYLVIEADEYRKAFLNYSPFAAIITNIDKEHLDFYKNLKDIQKSFLEFISRIKLNGFLVVNKDDKNLCALKTKIKEITDKKRLQVIWYSLHDKKLKSSISRIRKVIQISGEHNVSNALGAYLLSKNLGIKDKDIFKTLGHYQSAWRRMEYKGKFQISKSKFQIDVYDDYAHHPTEIKATLSGIRQKWPKTSLICVFQPHQAKRLAALFKEFTGAFFYADALILLPIYQVPGRDKVSHNISSEQLANSITRKLKNFKLKTVVYLPSPKNLRTTLAKMISNSHHSHTMVVMMGAGDIVNYTPLLLSSDSKRKS